MFSLTELKILEMRATRLRFLPVTLPKLTKLERLDLGANSFVEFVKISFSHYSHRKFFSLAERFDKFTVIERVVVGFESFSFN